MRSRSRNELKIHLKIMMSAIWSATRMADGKLLVSAIRKRFKGQSFLTEEKWVSYKPKTQTWIIDPIDGTTNFVTWKRDYTIPIAIMRKNVRFWFGLRC
ncbi:MAG: inositol monophosphatase family protein [Holdemania massiliensis]